MKKMNHGFFRTIIIIIIAIAILIYLGFDVKGFFQSPDVKTLIAYLVDIVVYVFQVTVHILRIAIGIVIDIWNYLIGIIRNPA